MPASPPMQTGRRMAARATVTRRDVLDHPRRAPLHHHPNDLSAVTRSGEGPMRPEMKDGSPAGAAVS